jgi:hypothetical protein
MASSTRTLKDYLRSEHEEFSSFSMFFNGSKCFFGQLMSGYFVCHESLPAEPKDVPRSFENVQVMEASANSASQVPC